MILKQAPSRRPIYTEINCSVWRNLVLFVRFKNVKNTHGRVLLLKKLQAKACSFTESNTPPWVFFTFFKLPKWYEIAQRISVVESIDLWKCLKPCNFIKRRLQHMWFLVNNGKSLRTSILKRLF